MTDWTALLSAGPRAFANLAAHEPDISRNFEIPMHVGKLIAAWDRPKFVPAAEAGHMRPDDYVVGLRHKGYTRAYPMWVTDNYHMINDKVAGDPVLYTTCERCQSGSAFISKVQDTAAKFSALGMHNASLTMMNRKRGPVTAGSLWLHYEGVAIRGPERGRFLEQLPTWHMTWAEWLALYPETDVMLAPDDVHHRDARHGHGREEIFSRPGMDQPLASTITGRFDTRYAENELVLGLNLEAGIRAYPLTEVKRAGSVVNDRLGELPVVIFSGPVYDQVSLAGYLPTCNGQALTFEHTGTAFRDRETGSIWTLTGEAIAGPLEGQILQPLRGQYVRWHAWIYPHPGSELFLADSDAAAFATAPQCQVMQPLLDGLQSLGRPVRIHHVTYNLCLPHEAAAGLVVHVGGDRLNLYHFANAAAAADYVALQGAWFCWPFGVKLGRKRAHAVGPFVVESDPENTFAEPTQIIRYPDNQIPWSDLVNDPAQIASWSEALPASPDTIGPYATLITGLQARRIDIVEAAFLPHTQQRPGTISSLAATIEADRFAIHRCISEEAADAVIQDVGHAFRIGTWVFRSIPVLMYRDPHYEMGMLPDEKIAWSPLLQDQVFQRVLCEILLP